MLIKAATPNNIASFIHLFPNFTKSIDTGTKSQIHLYQILMAIDRISKKILGIVAFSKEYNRIGFLGVTQDSNIQKVGKNLLGVTINQLDNTSEISTYFAEGKKEYHLLFENAGFTKDINEMVNNGSLFSRLSKSPTMKKGYSFHFDYSGYIEWMDEQKCPFCRGELPGNDHILIKELEHSFVHASDKAQGALWGKCHIISKKHYIELHDLPSTDLVDFMSDVQKTARALKEVSGAVKINLEQHGNTVPHLHFHLYPRYLDDLFPGKAIDYNITEPTPYESKAEFQYYMEQMREKLSF